MTSYQVPFRAEAVEQLEELYDFIAAHGSATNAASFTDAIVSFGETLSDFPYRGTARDDIRPALRTIGFKRRVIVAYAVLDETVTIVGIFCGGRDHENLLSVDDQI